VVTQVTTLLQNAPHPVPEIQELCLADGMWEASSPTTVTRTENPQIATVSCKVGMLSVSFVPEVPVLEIGAQFMGFPRAYDALITSCFLIDDHLASHSQHTDNRVLRKKINKFRHVA
jgi:hypothetical protein